MLKFTSGWRLSIIEPGIRKFYLSHVDVNLVANPDLAHPKACHSCYNCCVTGEKAAAFVIGVAIDGPVMDVAVVATVFDSVHEILVVVNTAHKEFGVCRVERSSVSMSQYENEAAGGERLASQLCEIEGKRITRDTLSEIARQRTTRDTHSKTARQRTT